MRICFSVFLLFLGSLSTALAETDSTWTATGDGNWFDTQNWSGPVPDGAVDIARVQRSTGGPVLLSLGSSVTLGQLRLAGAGSFTLTGTDPLLFDNRGEGARLDMPLTSRWRPSHVLEVPIAIAPGEQLFTDIAANTSLTLKGGITQEGSNVGGDIVKGDHGALVLAGASPDWEGSLTVNTGELRLEHTKGLLNSSSVNMNPGSVLTVVSQDTTEEDSHDSYIIPHLVLNNSILQTNRGYDQNTTDLEASIELQGDNTIRVPTSDALRLQGSISGEGGVSFLHLVDPTSIVNPFSANYLIIDGPTSYSGETLIGPDAWVLFRSPSALGNTEGDTLVQRKGALELHQGGGAERIVVDQGRLVLGESVNPYGHTVQLRSGNLDGGDDIQAVLNTRVEYTEGALLGSESMATNLALSGGIEGVGSVAIQNLVEIQEGITARGNLYIRNRAGAVLSGPLDVSGDVFVSRGRLRVSGDLEAPVATFRVASFGLAESILEVASNNTLKKVIIDPRGSDRENLFNRTTVSAVDDAVLTITDELRFLGGTLHGAIQGQAVLAKQDRTEGVLSEIAGSGFERVNVEAGNLIIQGDAGAFAPDIHLSSHDTSRVFFQDTGVYSGDIYLNNARGSVDPIPHTISGKTALTLAGDSTLTGNIYLGDRGATLGGQSQIATQKIGHEAVIHGGDLTVLGRAHLQIHGGNHTYSGVTQVMAENLILIDEGRLNSTSAVIGSGRIASSGGRGGLLLDNSGTMAHNDRIPDNTPVHLNGMLFTLLGREGEAVTETLGTVHVTRGISDLVVENPNTLSETTELRIQTLNRQPGGVVQFKTNNTGAKISLNDAPTLDNGLIGGWALFGADEFATYGPNGVVPYSELHDYASDLPTATAGDNVLIVSENPTLSGDRSIHSLTVRDTDIDLAGNRLTIESGGLLSRVDFSTINGPGELTAGTETGAELLVTGFVRIDANITDNAEGAVGLTVSTADRGHVTLSGENTYSGPTVINSGTLLATLEIVSESALPVGGDIFLNGGELRINHQPSAPLQLGRIELRNSALVRSTSGFTPQLQPTSVLIESGQFVLDIVGNAPITKTSPRDASFSTSLANHSGPILIEEGRLSVGSLGPAPLDNAHAITIRSGGRLRLERGPDLPDRKILLEGGVLELVRGGSLSGWIDVSEEGGTLRGPSTWSLSINSAITGRGDLAIEGPFGGSSLTFDADLSDFQGDLLLTGGQIVMNRSNPDYNGHIRVANENLIPLGTNLFGTNQVTILPAGQITVSQSMTANLRLDGGVLRMELKDNRISPILSGELTVAGQAYLFITPGFDGRQNLPRIRSDLHLEEGSHLTITQDPGSFSDYQGSLFREHLHIDSDLTVEGMATLTSFDTTVDLLGTISPTSPTSVLNLVGNQTFNVSASVQLSDGYSLSIVQDDEISQIVLGYSAMSLSGNGKLINDVALRNGATVSPGDSAGELIVDGDVSMEEGAIYEWEIGDASGVAGTDWDLWRIEGELAFEATPSNPWILKISDLPGLASSDGSPWIIATAEEIQGFDPAALQIDVSGIDNSSPLYAVEQFVVFRDGNNLLLHSIPEPGTSLMLFIAIVFYAGKRSALKKHCVSGPFFVEKCASRWPAG